MADNALVSVWGNRYSVPPGLVAAEVTVSWRVGTETIDIAAPAGGVVVTHRLAPRGAGRTVRLPEHTAALANVVLGAFSSARPCDTKPHRPPSGAARAIAAEITATPAAPGPVIDLGAYQQVIDRRGQAR